MKTVQETPSIDACIMAYKDATATLNKTLKETQLGLIATAACGPLTQTEYRRAVATISQAHFDYQKKMGELCPEVFPNWYHGHITPTEANRQNIESWDCIDDFARRQVREIVTLVDDSE